MTALRWRTLARGPARLGLQTRMALWVGLAMLAVLGGLTLFLLLTQNFIVPGIVQRALDSSVSGIVVLAPGTDHPAPSAGMISSAVIEQMRLLALSALIVSIPLVACVAYFVVRRGLRPLRTTAEIAGDISAGSLDARLPVPEANDEVAQLAGALNEMLERLDRAFRQQRNFVGDAAHELRTPISTIRTLTEVALAEGGPSHAAALRAVHSNADRLQRVTSGLLLLAEDQRIDPEPVLLWPLLEGVRDELAPAASERQVSISVKGELEAEVMGSPNLLDAIFRNLVENAIWYNRPNGRVTLHVSAEEDEVRVEVRDTGIGLSKQEQARVFDRFFRANRSRSMYERGTGLGLAIVAHFVEQHQGSVAVSSVLGEGSVFTVRLPRLHADFDSYGI